MKKILTIVLGVVVSSLVYAENHIGIGGYYGYASPADLGDGQTYGLYLDCDFNDNFTGRMGFGYMTGFEVEDYDRDSFIGYVGQTFHLDDIDIGAFEIGGIVKFHPIEDFVTIYCGLGLTAYYIPDINIYGRNYREDVTVEFDATVGVWGTVGVEIGSQNFKVFVELKGTWADNPNVDIAIEDWYRGYYGDVKVDLTNVQTLAGARIVF